MMEITALKVDEVKFFDYFRMSVASFEELFSLLAHHLQKKYIFRKPIEPLEMLGLTIR